MMQHAISPPKLKMQAGLYSALDGSDTLCGGTCNSEIYHLAQIGKMLHVSTQDAVTRGAVRLATLSRERNYLVILEQIPSDIVRSIIFICNYDQNVYMYHLLNDIEQYYESTK